MTAKEKLVFIISFVVFLHWGVNVSNLIINNLFYQWLYTHQGDWKVDPNKDVTFPLVDWIVKLFPVLKDKEIEINQVDLGDEFAFGFCQDNDGEFLIHVHNRLDLREYVKTLIHEFTHVRQTVDGITDSNAREDEAYYLEEQLSKAFWDRLKSGTSNVES